MDAARRNLLLIVTTFLLAAGGVLFVWYRRGVSDETSVRSRGRGERRRRAGRPATPTGQNINNS